MAVHLEAPTVATKTAVASPAGIAIKRRQFDEENYFIFFSRWFYL